MFKTLIKIVAKRNNQTAFTHRVDDGKFIQGLNADRLPLQYVDEFVCKTTGGMALVSLFRREYVDLPFCILIIGYVEKLKYTKELGHDISSVRIPEQVEHKDLTWQIKLYIACHHPGYKESPVHFWQPTHTE